jgi:hypothetical protein
MTIEPDRFVSQRRHPSRLLAAALVLAGARLAAADHPPGPWQLTETRPSCRR